MNTRLTLSLLSLPQDGVQPPLLVICVLGHADKPLVLRRVVDLPTVGHRVVVAVIVRWKEHSVSLKHFNYLNPCVPILGRRGREVGELHLVDQEENMRGPSIEPCVLQSNFNIAQMHTYSIYRI